MNIYVANINFKSSEDDLRELFGRYGEISTVKILTDKVTGRSRGFGFVEMPNDDEGRKAVNELNGTEYFQRNLVVNEAKPREEGDQPRRSNNRREFGSRF